MKTRGPLQEALAEWRRLANNEEAAIRIKDWPLLALCQDALQQLQPRITHLIHRSQQNCVDAGIDAAAEHQWLRTAVNELIEIESRNRVLLEETRRNCQTQFSELQQTGRILRQVQRSYAPARAPVWTSFS